MLGPKITFKYVFDALLQNIANPSIQINVTVSFRPTAAEIEEIVTVTINVTIDFWPSAAEIEQIVTLIANVKRNI